MTSANIFNPAQMPDPDLVTQAQAAIDEFAQSSAPGIWPAINKEQLITEMRSRIQDPFSVDQGRQPFCGPSSILFELIRRNPPKYVQICRNLYQVGGFNAQTKWVQPSDKLRLSKGNLQMPQADWMVVATLRESENLLFPVQPDAPDIIRNISGMTKPWEMQGWVQEILGYRDAKVTTAFVMGDFQVMQEATDILNAGGVALMLITAEGLLSNSPPPIPFPSHWVALAGDVSIQTGSFTKPGRISFDIFTWARKMHIDVAEGPFKSYFWAAVTGRP